MAKKRSRDEVNRVDRSFQTDARAQPARPESGADKRRLRSRLHELSDLGQSVWIDFLSRQLIQSGKLARMMEKDALVGVTSNPTIFQKAIAEGALYDESMRRFAGEGRDAYRVFEGIEVEDVCASADLFRPVYDRTAGDDGFVSIEVGPHLARDTKGTIEEARRLWQSCDRQNVMVKIPGTAEGVPAIEESIFNGVPINVTLLFSREQYIAAAEAWMRGVERRLAAGLDPAVTSVASLFISRWDKAVSDKVPAELRNRLGIAIGARTYRAYRELLASPRWRKLAAAGARPQRLLWASTGTKDPKAPDTLYIEALAAPDTIDTIPEKTLRAFAEHGELKGVMAEDGGDAEAVLARFTQAGIDLDALAQELQRDGAQAFVKSWKELLQRIADKSEALAHAS